jgi:hypothetical protein
MNRHRKSQSRLSLPQYIGFLWQAYSLLVGVGCVPIPTFTLSVILT